MKFVTATALFFGLLAWAFAGKDEDDVTADILKNLQDSGVMDNVKAELEKMLHDKDKMAELKEQILEKEKALKDKIAQQVKEGGKKPDTEVLDFATSYAQETGLKLSKDLVKKVSGIPSDAKKTVHKVHLSAALDQLASAIDDGIVSESDVIGTDFKSLQQLKETIEEKKKSKKDVKKQQQPKKKVEEPKKEQPKAPTTTTTKKEGQKKANEMSSAIRSFAAMAGNNPQMLINAMLMGMSNYQVVSEETLSVMRSYADQVAKIEGLGDWIRSAAETLAWLVEHEEGQNLFQILPMFVDENKREEAFEKLNQEGKRQWSKFFNVLQNSDLKRSFLVQCADYMVSAHKYATKDPMKMMVANAFLISQGLPTLAPKNLVESVLDLADKSLRLFTTVGDDIDLKQYKPAVRNFIKNVEQEYVASDMFDKLSDQEKAELIAQFLDENVVSAAQEVAKAHDSIRAHPECAEVALCAINAHAQGHIKAKVTEGLTTTLAWVWIKATPEDVLDEDAEVKFFEAIEHGVGKKKQCAEIYPKAPQHCKVFEWQKENIMNLDFDHDEL